MAKMMVQVLANEVDVTTRFCQITFAKNVHGFVTDVIAANFETEWNPQTVEAMRKAANDHLEFVNEKLASR